MTENPKKPRKLSFKQKGFIKDLIETKGNATKSALMNYDTKSYKVASAIGCENLEKPSIQQEIVRLATKFGLSPEKAMEILANEAINGSDKLKALGLYFDINGLKAPTKTENKNLNEHTMKQNESDLIALKTREALNNALTKAIAN